MDEVLGSDSPVSMKIKAQQAAARRAREEDGLGGASDATAKPEAPRKPLTEPEVAPTAVAEEPKRTARRSEKPRRSREARGAAKAEAKGIKKKQKPAKRIPVTGTEGDVWEGVCRTMSSCVGAKVTFAAASRAIWSMIVDIEDDLERFDAPQLEKPAHADAVANADFEDQLRGFLLEVIQKSKRH